jgi:cysteine desulfurase
MGQSDDAARSALRFSLGHTSTREDLDLLIAVLPGAVERARAAAGFLSPGVR